MIVIDEAKTMDLVVAAVKSAIQGEDVVIVVNGMKVALVPVDDLNHDSEEEDAADIALARKVLADPSRWVSREEARSILRMD